MLTLDGKNWWRGPDVCRTLPERIATLASIAYSMWYTHGNRELSRAPLEAYRSVWRMAVRAEDKGGWNEDDWIEVQRRLAHGSEMTEYVWDAAHDDESLEDVWDADGIRRLESACDPFGLPPRPGKVKKA